MRKGKRVYDIGFKAVEIFLVHCGGNYKFNQSWKSIELLLYRLKYTEVYYILILMQISSHNKLNKTGLAFV